MKRNQRQAQAATLALGHALQRGFAALQLELFPGTAEAANRARADARLALALQREIDYLADELERCQARTERLHQRRSPPSKVPELLRQLHAIETALSRKEA